MPTLTQPPSPGDLLKYELNPNHCREAVTLLAGTDYALGAVLGQITASGKFKLATDTGADGAETAAAVLLGAVDATAADATGVVLRRGPAIVAKTALIFDASVSDAAKVATKHTQLIAAGIVPRDVA
ncbi:MAG: head decoration protein [Alphaproteobacteria bacterium HGW-Alphaproteobacteria-8]|nr:MAG: head decoration protein [Alphaproteobacteria bacterium HGW-Alphaproteobacteria-8]